MKKLYTIGYEGAELAHFVKTLKAAKVDLLLDVRELPISRRKGFSKTALCNALEEVGIDYRHEKQLGSPKQIRHQLRKDWNYPRFFQDFEQHLEQHMDLLKALAQELRGNVALMCYERDHKDCHRHTVADALSGLLNNKTPIHLGVNSHAETGTDKARPHPGKSLSAA